ncbi:MAG: HNH endonuclease [Betaproteobacteria bacterium]|nr:HNH endonuclease [Betaproteobacteria bacterium]
MAKRDLVNTLVRSVEQGGWTGTIAEGRNPYVLKSICGGAPVAVRAYIWNCTHGGGRKRAKDEYRIQFTTAVTAAPGLRTLLLGWHQDCAVFAAWDISRHIGQGEASQSAQVKIEILERARDSGFATYQRHNGELVVAFRPEFLVDYASSAQSFHESGKAAHDMALLNSLDNLAEDQISSLAVKRKTIIQQIVRKYREQSFRRRVLSAYGHRCAMCGLQMDLLDAAHIVPVTESSSTDETRNGVALCKIHHAAFDRNIVSFSTTYRVELSRYAVDRLAADKLADGLLGFKRNLRTSLLLPSNLNDRPPSAYINLARKVRKWRA